MSDAIHIHAQQIEMIPLAALKDYGSNARTHPPSQIQVLANIVREHGWTTPLLIDDDDVIVAGHGRLEVAKKLKMTEVPCVRLSGLTPDQLKSVRLSDNQTGLLSDWNDALLKIDLGLLQGAGFDLSLTGFSSLELTGIFSTVEGHTDPDEVPDAPVEPVSQLGDVWLMGAHILVCGDCTDPEVVAKALAGHTPHLMVTDQPYGTNYRSGRRGTEFLVDGGKRATGDVLNDKRADWREAWAHFHGDVAYIWHNPLETMTVQGGLESLGFEVRAQIIWRKNTFVIGPPKGHYHWRHESCFYCVRKGKTGHWTGSRKDDTVWDMDRPRKSETGHSTQKPVEAMARPIRNNSNPGDHVFEPFSGSFTTGIACQMHKRVCHAIELSPAFVDVGVRRWESFTGQKATLDGDGRTFDEIAAERLTVV